MARRGADDFDETPHSSGLDGVPEHLRGLVEILIARLVSDILAGRLEDSPSPEQHGGDADAR